MGRCPGPFGLGCRARESTVAPSAIRHILAAGARLIDVSGPSWADGRVGRVLGGSNAGRFVKVDQDSSGTGFHIWLSERHPDEGPSQGWDIWADNAEDVDEWFAGELATVQWS